MDMKKIYWLLICLQISAFSYAQSSWPASERILDELQEWRKTNTCPENYKLYPTQNLWTFLKLDTRTGKIWHVQYSVKGEGKRFEYVLDANSRAPYGEDSAPGRFELYPTQNLYNFILLDKVSGGTWQVQWSVDGNEGVWRIGY